MSQLFSAAWHGAGVGTAEHPPCVLHSKAAFLECPFQPFHQVNAQSLAQPWASCTADSQAEMGCGASHGCKHAVNIPPRLHGCSPPAPQTTPAEGMRHLLPPHPGCPQGLLWQGGQLPRCQHRMAPAGTGRGQGRWSAVGAEHSPRTVSGACSIPAWCLGAAPSFLLSHGSCPRLKLRSCSRAAQAVQLSGGGWSHVFPFWLHILLYKASKSLLLKLLLPVSNKERRPPAHYMRTHYIPRVDSWQERDGSEPGMSPNPTSNKQSAPLGPRDHTAEQVSVGCMAVPLH